MSIQMDGQDLLTIKEAAVLAHVTRRTIRPEPRQDAEYVEKLRAALDDMIDEAEGYADYSEEYRCGIPRFDDANKDRRERIAEARALLTGKESEHG